MIRLREINEVSTGEVRTVYAGVLAANALGSCVAVVAYDPHILTGGIAHVMLPGKPASERMRDPFRYAKNAIDELLRQMGEKGAFRRRICVAVAGGGNVLQRDDDTICAQNIHSVLGILQEYGLAILARDLGGVLRRRVTLDAKAGRIYCAAGDGPETLLWSVADRAWCTEK